MTDAKWPLDDTIRLADRTLELALPDAAALNAHLEAATIEGLVADSAALRTARDGQINRPGRMREATLTQDEAVLAGAALVETVRFAVGRAKAGKKNAKLKAAVGVGSTASLAGVKGSSAALDKIVAASEGRLAADLRRCGVLPAMIESAGELSIHITGADRVQEARGEAGVVGTSFKNVTLVRAIDDIDAIIAAAQLAFYKTNPARAKLYRDLIPSHPKKATPTGAGGTTGGAT